MSLSLRESFRRRLFDAEEISSASKADKILMNLLDSKVKLSENEELYKERLFQCFHILSENYRQAVAIRILKEKIPTLCYGDLMQLIQDTQNVFGKVTQRNYIFDLNLQRERILKHLEYLQKPRHNIDFFGNPVKIEPGAKEFDSIARFEKLLFDIEAKINEQEPVISNPEHGSPMPRVVFSTDPQVLLNTHYNENE